MNKNRYKISVIIPVYNVEKYLRQCLDSVANQTLKDIEIICVNDSSPDNSLAILEEYKAKDDRFIIITQPNQGQGVARNNALKIAKGEFITYVDADDWIELDMLEKMYQAAIENNVKVVQCNHYNIKENDDKKIIFNYFEEAEQQGIVKPNSVVDLLKIKKNILRSYKNGPCGRIYQTQFLKDNNIQFAPFKKAEDHPFSIEVKILTPIYFLKEPLYYYRARGNSSRSEETVIEPIVDAVQKILEKHNLMEYLQDEFDDYKVWRYLAKLRKAYKRKPLAFIKDHKAIFTTTQLKMAKKGIIEFYFNRFFYSWAKNIFSIEKCKYIEKINEKLYRETKKNCLVFLGLKIKLEK